MSDKAGLPIDPDQDSFSHSNTPELKHTNLSLKSLDDERSTDSLNLTNVASRRRSRVNL